MKQISMIVNTRRMKNLVKSETRTNTNITQRFLNVAHRNKLDALTRILEVTEFEAMIMFVRTKFETEELAEKLRACGFNATAINGDIAQQQRERTVEQRAAGYAHPHCPFIGFLSRRGGAGR